MKRLLLLLAILFCWVGCEEEPTPVLVSVVTGEATDITTNSASVQVSMDENDRIDEIGVLCSADSLFQVSHSLMELIFPSDHKCTCKVIDLLP